MLRGFGVPGCRLVRAASAQGATSFAVEGYDEDSIVVSMHGTRV